MFNEAIGTGNKQTPHVNSALFSLQLRETNILTKPKDWLGSSDTNPSKTTNLYFGSLTADHL